MTLLKCRGVPGGRPVCGIETEKGVRKERPYV